MDVEFEGKVEGEVGRSEIWVSWVRFEDCVRMSEEEEEEVKEEVSECEEEEEGSPLSQ